MTCVSGFQRFLVQGIVALGLLCGISRCISTFSLRHHSVMTALIGIFIFINAYHVICSQRHNKVIDLTAERRQYSSKSASQPSINGINHSDLSASTHTTPPLCKQMLQSFYKYSRAFYLENNFCKYKFIVIESKAS